MLLYIIIISLLYLNLVLAFGFPVCPENGVLNCLNDTDFTISNNFGVMIISNCIYVGCPSLVINTSIAVINNVTFKDSVGPSITTTGSSYVNISNVEFNNSSLSVNGISANFNVIRCLFKSTRLEVTGSSHNISIDNSEFIDNQTPDSGGAILINSNDASVSLVLTNSLFSRNSAGKYGGALFLSGLTNSYIFNSTFTENSSNQGGVLVVSAVSLQIIGCKFIGNSATQKFGAVFIEYGSSALIENTLFLGNNAPLYGVIEILSIQFVTIRNCHFEGNSALNGYGSIHAELISDYLLVDSCTFLNNSSPNGYSASLALLNVEYCSITNSTFTSESASDLGGSLSSQQSNLFISNCTFVDCSSIFNGGVLYLRQSFKTVIVNTIFKNTFANQGGVIYAYLSEVFIGNCTQSDSQAISGASILLDTSTATIQNCRFINNIAYSLGGSIYALYSAVKISGSYYYNGSAQSGGQIFIDHGRGVAISNCTFDRNSAENGGFLFVQEWKKQGLLSVTSCAITNSFASNGAGALVLLSSVSLNFLIQNCSFYNSSSNSFSGLTQITCPGTVIIENCDIANSFSLIHAIGKFAAVTFFTNCSFLNSVSMNGDGNLGVVSTVYLTNCTVIGAKSSIGGFATIGTESSLFVSGCRFSDISANYGGIIYSTRGSSSIFTGCTFEAVNAFYQGVIAFTYGFVELIDCEIHGSDSAYYSSPLFYASKTASKITIDGLRIEGKIPDFDGSIMKCQSGGNAFMKELSLSSSQSILQSVIAIDILSSITITDSVLIDVQGSSLIKASSFSRVTLMNCSISFSEGASSSSMDQVFSLESGSSINLISSKISNFQGKVAVIFTLGEGTFNCLDSTLTGTRVPESTVKLYNGKMASINCIFQDNVATGSVNECISRGLGKEINAVGGAIFGYSSSIVLVGGTLFSGNEAELGGAMYCANCELIIDDAIFGNNSASLNGGAIWSDSSNIQIGKCQVSENKALNLPASNDFFLSSGQLGRVPDSSDISIYVADDSLSNYILSNSDMTSFAGLRGSARSFSVLEYSDTIYINSTSDNLPSITIVALDIFNETVSIDTNDPIIIQVFLEDNNYSSYLSGERSKLMVTEKAIFSDLEIVGKVPGASYNVTISSSNRPSISSVTLQVWFQECDSETQVLVKGTSCVPLLVGNSGGVSTLISVFWMISFLIIGVSLVYLHKFRHYDLIKVNSFTFLFSSGIGSLIAVSAPLFYFFELGCIPAIFLERIGFTLVFAALSLKVYRINTIFNSMSRSGLQNSRLIRILGILVLIVFSYIVVWVVLDPPKVTLTYSSQLNVVIKNSCPINSLFAIAIEMAQFSAVLILSYLAYLTRSVPEKFNEAKVIGFACYNWLLFGSFFYLTAEYFIASPGLKVIFKAFSLYTSHLIITTSLITLKVYRIQKLMQRNVTEETKSDAIGSTVSEYLQSSFFTGAYFESRFKRSKFSEAGRRSVQVPTPITI